MRPTTPQDWRFHLLGWRDCQIKTDQSWFWTQASLAVLQAAAMGRLEDAEIWMLDNELANWDTP